MEIQNYESKYQEECRKCLLSAWDIVKNKPLSVIDYIHKHANAKNLKTTLNKVIIINEQIIALMFCKVKDNSLYIKHLAVCLEYQGQGIGKDY